MKTMITFLFLTVSLSLWSQSHIIVKHNGEKIAANYLKTQDYLMYYNTGQDQVEQTVSTFAVAELIHTASQAVTKISDKIIINGEQDCDKVKVIPARHHQGLVASTQKITLNNRVKGQTPLAVQQQNIALLKRKAAKEGVPFVSIASIDRNVSNATLLTY